MLDKSTQLIQPYICNSFFDIRCFTIQNLFGAFNTFSLTHYYWTLFDVLFSFTPSLWTLCFCLFSLSNHNGQIVVAYRMQCLIFISMKKKNDPHRNIVKIANQLWTHEKCAYKFAVQSVPFQLMPFIRCQPRLIRYVFFL